MKKITLKGARMLACAALFTAVASLTAFSFADNAAVSLQSGESYSPYYHGDRSKACVAIMINVYENSDIVCKMVDFLTEAGAKATFFVGGCWADDNTETLKKIAESGMEIGNHGYFHKDCKKISAADCEREIVTNHTLIKQILNVEMKLFAPPSGSYDVSTLKIAEKSGYKTIMWSKDTIDWRDGDVDTLVKRATEKYENGDMILMHPKPHSLTALKRIVDFYKKNNVETLTVSEII